MAGRETRRRATVNYSQVELEKGSATPTWLNSKSRRATIDGDLDGRQSGAAEPAAKGPKAEARHRKDVTVAKPGKQRKASTQRRDSPKDAPAPAKHAARASAPDEGTLAEKPAAKQSKHSKATVAAVAEPEKRLKARGQPPAPFPDAAPAPPPPQPRRKPAPSPAAAAAAVAAARGETSKQLSGSKREAKEVTEEGGQGASKRRRSAPEPDATAQSGAPPPPLKYVQ